ncbi:MAG: PDZ domain-containing protein [Melioribacteraceae bacterium]|nr:PDZ domain-containing protein [Melioribacteraceae bacterium]
MKKMILLFMLISIVISAQNTQTTRLLRFPDIYKDKVAFVYAGDIWIGNTNGGTAKRLTSHQGMELFPKFSPDGRWIAFSGEYAGNRQVFVISVDGGSPKQLTFYNDVGNMPPRGGFDYRILDWTPDGKNVIFRANRLPWGIRLGKYFSVSIDGGMETPLEIPEGGGGMLSPDGKKMVYTPIDREFRTWKRYRGGRAQDVWIYDFENHSANQITTDPATDNQPVWVGDKIYFASDRDYTLNLFSYDLSTQKIEKVTNHDFYDVLWVSAGPENIVYENGGYIYKYSPATSTSEMIPINVFGDFPFTQPYFKNVKENIESYEISSTGLRALFCARGEIFTVPAENGAVNNITNTPGIREINAVWSPDGETIAYLSDRTGEYEIYTKKSDGSGEEVQITENSAIWYFGLRWSPDSKKIAIADKNQMLHIVDVESKKVSTIDNSERNDITYYRWAPDSKWLAYTKVAETDMSVIWVYSLDKKEKFALTDPMVGNSDPVFDKNGEYLYFLSNRDYNLSFSSYEFNYLYNNATRVYVAALSKKSDPIFDYKNDEEINKSAEEKSEGEDKSIQVEIDVDGFENRVNAIPGSSGNYSQLSAGENGIYFVDNDNGNKLKYYDVKEEKESTIFEGIGGYEISADGKKMIFGSRGNFGIVETKPNQSKDKSLDLSKMDMKIFPKMEWEQMFVDGWRIIRDWFYDKNLHGMDWQNIREKYSQLLPFVSSRADLDYIFGEMGGELNAGHFYVNSGDQPSVERTNGGLLGAEIVASGEYYKINKIFAGENWHSNFRSPLTEFGVNVNEGDYILKIDGKDVSTSENFYKYLENKADQQVTLLVNNKASVEGAHEEIVKPVRRETDLRYLDWVKSRQKYVDEKSNGKIGYIHLPNTATDGNRELFKYFYPQANKKALIIDVRYNGGGFIPDRMIELLERTPMSKWARRGIEPFQTPGFAHNGPKTVLINHYSSSGGDAFPYYFRQKGLGKLIGTRTWGGLIGLSGNPGLMDGGSLSIPTFRFIGPDSQWAVENEGVAPDIEVVDRPDLVAKGADPSLDKAIEIMLDELAANPPKSISVPQPPDHSKKK